MNPARNRLDQLIDEGLASYANAAPRWGLETRVLRNVLGKDSAAYRFPRWAWAIPALVIGFALGIAVAPPIRTMFSAALNPSLIGEWCARLEASSLSTRIRESELFWWYIEGGHLMALAVMLGPALMLDLRLIGVLWTGDPVSKVEKRFLPITITGFGVVVATGLLLFISEPVKCYESPYFRIKMCLILIAGLNALVFHSTIDRRRDEWNTTLPTPRSARVAGVLGLLIWTAVIFAGRYMAYTFS
ncbi:MAG TPA: DUF6644 family protein [Terriglobia bacterium]|nr:DUF6644 family protein [Terriglobia bacterium]